MPSGLMDRQGVSPSFFSQEAPFSDGRQVGFWKTDAMHNFYGTKTDGTLATVSRSLEKRLPFASQMAKGLEHPNAYLNLDQVNPSSDKFPRSASFSVPKAFQDNLGSASYFIGGDKVNHMGAQYENGLFSSSLSDLFTKKLGLSLDNTPHRLSVGAANPHEEEEPLESLEELEAQTIGNLLPDDDDLFSGVNDGMEYNTRLTSGDDVEDLDLFSSVGGLDLGEDGLSSGEKKPESFNGISNGQLGDANGTFGGQHHFVEHPSRTLFVRNINSNVEDSELQSLFEQYGEIRTLYTTCKHRGFVMISYYDVRSARNAMKALQDKPLRRRKLDIHYSIPKDNLSEKDVDQGTLLVSNLDSSVSNDELRQIFGAYGEIKEIRETSLGSHQRFVEFYDVRAADAALRALSRIEISGRQIKVEASRPGGSRWSMGPLSSVMDQDESGLYSKHSTPPSSLTSGFSGPVSHGGITSHVENGTLLGAQTTGHHMSPYLEKAFPHGISSSVPNSLPSLLRAESFGNLSNTSDSRYSHGQQNFEIRGSPNFHPHSLPDCDDGLANGSLGRSPGNMTSVFSASANGSSHSPVHHYMWSNSHRPQPQGIMWPNSSGFIGTTSSALPQQLHGVARGPSRLSNGLLPMHNQHVGSAPTSNPSIWERHHAYNGESPDASGFHPGSLGSMRIPGNSPHFMELIPHNVFPGNGGSCMDRPIPSKNMPLSSHNQRCLIIPERGQMIPIMSSFDSTNERTRSRRNEGSSSQSENKKQFELDIERIMRGEDKRTTLMIKNIPNKYTSKMLLAAIDERHKGTYDFLYLPIDFKNKCNVGYAFINMTDPSLIIPFYHSLNGKKWEKFNSEKVASLAYARIQGKAALVAHFQNSSLMNEDKRCRPILFHTDGPNAGDQVPFPMGVNIRPRTNKNRSITSEENNQDGKPNPTHGDESSTGNSSSVSVKDSE